jgi:hypothetical protein
LGDNRLSQPHRVAPAAPEAAAAGAKEHKVHKEKQKLFVISDGIVCVQLFFVFFVTFVVKKPVGL